MIFVCIASYADPELPRTLRDCVLMARHPDDLRFGICWQDDPEAKVELEAFRQDARFRFADYTVAESRGGTWARSIAGSLWEGEDFTLQIDSHMKFEPDWDVRLLGMVERLDTPKPLLTIDSPVFYYDANGTLHRDLAKGVPTSRVSSWGAGSGWSPWSIWGPPHERLPAPIRMITGNFVFTLGRWNEEVPQDPEHYYWGEEWSLSVRSFTHGYDLFAPEEIVVWHMNHLDGGPRRHWEKGQEVVAAHNLVAFDRLDRLIYADDPEAHRTLGRYGLGDERTLRDFEIFSGFDLRRKVAHPDVFTGRPPDPVTIKSDLDWRRCITIEEAFRRDPSLDPQQGR